MDFEWDNAKEQANRKKHGIDFRTAAKVFLGPYVIEFEMISMPLLIVTYTTRGDVARIISARGAEPHEKRKCHEI